jgi:7-carboxy-7-deazaguanine synthase
MLVTEIFKSIQGESTWAGLPCSFVRLSGCNLRCSWCDTAYGWDQGTAQPIEAIVAQINQHCTGLVEITGGEPLLQAETPDLCRRLLDTGFTVLIETNGTLDISVLPEACIRIMDVKCPSAGVHVPFLADNLAHLARRDECKFVIANRGDFDFAADFASVHRLYEKCNAVIFSPVLTMLKPRDLAKWILDANIPVRLGPQLHKVIWGEETRGV